MRVLLISTYELGHQPFGLASPAAWLRRAGAEVDVLDVSVTPFSATAVRDVDLIAFYLPMHTATRLAGELLPRVRRLNPKAHLVAYGLYAPLNADWLQSLGVQTIVGGEFESGLVDVLAHLQTGNRPSPTPISLARQQFILPDRRHLPPPSDYAALVERDGRRRPAGYVEATRGCRHTCRHCPIVPIYNGVFRVVQADVVLADIRQQVAAGATHITFGDPDFLNGPGHARRIVTALHEEFPALTYDVTIKVEHLKAHAALLPLLRDTGCLFVTSAVEAIDDVILHELDKGHSRDDFVEVVGLMKEIGLALQPTFVTFTPWTTIDGYVDLLDMLHALDLVGAVPPIQYAIRLLLPAGSKLLERPSIQDVIEPFDAAALVYPWRHPDTAVDRLYEDVFRLVKDQQAAPTERAAFFEQVYAVAAAAAHTATGRHAALSRRIAAIPVPGLSESWY